MKKILLVISIFVIISVTIVATATPDAPDYIILEWRSDSILMKWDGPTGAADYVGSLCIQRIQPFEPITRCVWDSFGRYTTQNNIWFVIPYDFSIGGTFRVNSGNVAAYDSLGNVMASKSFTSVATWTYPFKKYMPNIQKGSTNPYP